MGRTRMLGVLSLVALLAVGDGTAAVADRAGADPAAGPEPVVTLRLRVSGAHTGTGAAVTIAGTFRGRAVAGRRTYRLLPLRRGAATHRHGTAPAQRARVEEVFLDARSGSGYLRVVARGPLVGGPPIRGRGGVCERVSFEYTVHAKTGRALLRWACRPAGAERSTPVHLDVLRRPPDAIASSWTIVRRPCSPPSQATSCSDPG